MEDVMSILFLFGAGIIIGYTLYHHFWSIKMGNHPYLSIERVKKLKTRKEMKDARKQKNR